jgi:hypothetical protein
LLSSSNTVTLSIVETASIDLATALDNPSLVWTTGGSAAWEGQGVMTHDAVDAAQSGALLGSQESWLQTTVAGPGLLAFWWKVSSEMEFDFLELYLGGVRQNRSSGEEGWQQRCCRIPAGSQTLRWRYVKDGSTTLGQDRGWVDQVVFVPDSGPPVILTQPVTQTVLNGLLLQEATSSANALRLAQNEILYLMELNNPGAPTILTQPQSQTITVGSNVTFRVEAWSQAPPGYQWYFNSQAVASSLAAAFRVSVSSSLATAVPVYAWGGSPLFDGVGNPFSLTDTMT